MSETLISPRELRPMIGGLSPATVYRMSQEGTFPRPVVLARTKSGRPCRVAYVSTEVAAWIAARIEQGRDGEAA